MEAFSALLALCAGIHRSPVNSPHKGQWRGALMFSLICAWMNGWVINGETGDLRRNRANFDVIVMIEQAQNCVPYRSDCELEKPGNDLRGQCFTSGITAKNHSVHAKLVHTSSLGRVHRCSRTTWKVLTMAVTNLLWLYYIYYMWCNTQGSELAFYRNISFILVLCSKYCLFCGPIFLTHFIWAWDMTNNYVPYVLY